MAETTLPSQSELALFAKLLGQQPEPNEQLEPIRQPEPIALSPTDYLQKLDYHGITLLALANNTLPEEVIELIRSRKAMMAANELLKQQSLQELFSAFHAAGLERFVLFKGTALAYSVYPQPWLRPRTDSDCLIDHSQLADFARVFEALGYQKLFAIEGKHIHYQSTFSKALSGQSAINIDLHWRINNRKILARTFSVDELIETGQPLDELAPGVICPSKVNNILIASLHRLGHHIHEERLTWLYDIYLLAQSLSDSDWQALSEAASEKQLAAITLDALQHCQSLFELAIPEQAVAALEQAALASEPSCLFLNRGLSEWQYFWHDLQALSGTWPKVTAIWENLVPDNEYVKRQMHTESALLAHIKRISRGLKRAVKG